MQHTAHLVIRPEQGSDVDAIRTLTESAFRDRPYSSAREHVIVDRLREAGALAYSAVAVLDSRIVGHVALSPVRFDAASGMWLGLGPISVAVDLQGRGIGTALMHHALAWMTSREYAGCILVGDPRYYQRFGFRVDPAISVPGVPAEATMSKRFVASDAGGVVRFHPAFDS